MRRLTGAAFLTIDGVMQAPGGPSEDWTGGFEHGGWLAPLDDDGIGETVGQLFTPPYALLLGRRTYEIFAAHWPYVEGEAAAMGEALTAVDKYVLTRGPAPLDWANSHRLDGIAAVAALKATDGPDLLIQGSGTIYPALLGAGLIDRLVLMIAPVVLGSGKRLFGEGTPPGTMRLVDHKVTTAGTIIATYEPAGPVATASFDMPGEPSAREKARQEAMKTGW